MTGNTHTTTPPDRQVFKLTGRRDPILRKHHPLRACDATGVRKPLYNRFDPTPLNDPVYKSSSLFFHSISLQHRSRIGFTTQRITTRRSQILQRYGAGICCSWLHQPDVAGHLWHESPHPRFKHGSCYYSPPSFQFPFLVPLTLVAQFFRDYILVMRFTYCTRTKKRIYFSNFFAYKLARSGENLRNLLGFLRMVYAC